MGGKFQQIKESYDKFYKGLLKKGKFPVRTTEKGFWGTIPADDILEIFNKINLKNFKSFLDLGSGDGKIVLIASLFTKAAGIEFDKDLIKISNEMKNELNSKADFIEGDYFEHDLSGCDLIFINPDQNFYKLEEKLRKEFKGKLVAYEDVYKPINMKLIKEFFIGGFRVGVYENY